MKIRSGSRERKAGRSALEKGMVVCIVLTLVSSLFFVGTTLSWFSDTVGVGGTVIKTGDFAAQMVIVDNAQSSRMNVSSDNGSVLKQVIYMQRLDKPESTQWEPGAVFASNEIYVENTGDLDLEYRLDLLTRPEDILRATQVENESGMKLSEVLKFRIVDYAESYSDTQLDAMFKNETVDQRSQAVNATTTAGVRSLAAAENKNTPTKDTSFRIVGRMDADASREYQNLEFSTPFILVLRSQQAGSEWGEDTTTTFCTEEKHTQQLIATQSADAAENLYIDTQAAYWAYEKDAENGETHVYHCADCGEALMALPGAQWHAGVLEQVQAGETGGVWVVTVSSTQTDYYCRVCGARIATRAVDEAGNVTWTSYD